MSLQYWGRNFAGQSAQYAATPVTFSSLPPASSAEGQVRVLSDVNYIEVVSRGGVWRPRGGRQVLAQRHNNPVTRQDTSLGLTETIGTFPGGLVRAGMSISNEIWVEHSGISSSNRVAVWRVGNNDTSQVNINNSGTDLNTRIMGRLIAANDGAGPHKSLRGLVATYPNAGNSQNNTVDFSAPWTTEINGQSVNENAITITGATWSAGVATYTATAHTLAVGDKTTIASVTPSGYNQVGIVTEVPNANSFKMALGADPGAYTSGGTSSRISNLRILSYVMELWG